MTTFLLIRHGETDAVGKIIAGWMPGWHLNARGRQQAEGLAKRLANIKLRAIYTSPLERAIETAGPIAGRHGMEPRSVAALGEFGVGEWEGTAIAELEQSEEFRRFNIFRSGVRPPGGEMMIEAQARMVGELERLRVRHADETVAVVSHGDPLRAVIAWALGVSLDLLLRMEISPGSLSVVQADEWGARVMCVNQTEEVPA